MSKGGTEEASKKRFAERMEKEYEEWVKLGVDPRSFQPGDPILNMYIRMELVMEVLTSKGIIDKAELDNMYRELAPVRYAEIRKNMVEPTVREMRRQQIIQGILPNGPVQ
jgi:hypothetical protein